MRWQSTAQDFPSILEAGYLVPGNSGEDESFSLCGCLGFKFPDHTSAKHSSAYTVPVCSPYLLFSGPDLGTPMSSSLGRVHSGLWGTVIDPATVTIQQQQWLFSKVWTKVELESQQERLDTVAWTPCLSH